MRGPMGARRLLGTLIRWIIKFLGVLGGLGGSIIVIVLLGGLGVLAANFRFLLFIHNKKGGRSRLFFEAGLV
jgi:hypothetical protein